jgi:signal peptidase I
MPEKPPSMPEKPPSRAVAELLAVVAPPGVAHAYLGMPVRGAAWLGGSVLVGMGAMALGPSLGLGTWGVLGAMAVPWLGVIVDLAFVPSRRFGKASANAIGALAVVDFVAFVVLAVALRMFVIEAFKIPAGSMAPTLLVGDHIFVDKIAYRARAPRYGEVMVFAFPEHPEQDFVKRVVALPGDRLEVDGGRPRLNGWEVPHCKVGTWSYEDSDSVVPRHTGELDVEFLGDQAYLVFFDDASGGFPDRQGPFRAKPGEYWVLGDNRNNSHDSRMWFGGTGGGVPRRLVRGPAMFVWISTRPGAATADRGGVPVHGTTLPPGAESLQPALDACLKSRPPLSATTPPAPAP